MPTRVTCSCGEAYLIADPLTVDTWKCRGCGQRMTFVISSEPQPVATPPWVPPIKLDRHARPLSRPGGWFSRLPDWAQPMVVGSSLGLPILVALLLAFGRSSPAVEVRTEARTAARTMPAAVAARPPEPRTPPSPPVAGPPLANVALPSASSPASAPDPSAATEPYRSPARTSYRSSPRADPPSSTFVDQSQSNIGYTATGIPLQMGPRGGIYHYSKSGKKVYHSRK